MIYGIIILLGIVVAALVVDWTKAQALWQKNRTKHRAKAPSKPVAKPAKPAVATPAPLQEEDDFFSDAPPKQVALEETSFTAEPQYSSEVTHYLEEADIHFRKGEMKAAEDMYLKAALLDPKCSKAYSRLGVIYLEQGENLQDAEEAFRQALKTDPENGYILNNLGLVLYYQDRYADAIRQFEQSVRQDEFNAARHANLGMAYMAMRQYAKAESSFKKAFKLSPHELEYKDLLGEAIEKKNAHKGMIRR